MSTFASRSERSPDCFVSTPAAKAPPAFASRQRAAGKAAAGPPQYLTQR